MSKEIKDSPVINPEVLEGLQALQSKWAGLNGEINNVEYIIWGIYREQKLPTEREVLQTLSCLKEFTETLIALNGE